MEPDSRPFGVQIPVEFRPNLCLPYLDQIPHLFLFPQLLLSGSSPPAISTTFTVNMSWRTRQRRSIWRNGPTAGSSLPGPSGGVATEPTWTTERCERRTNAHLQSHRDTGRGFTFDPKSVKEDGQCQRAGATANTCRELRSTNASLRCGEIKRSSRSESETDVLWDSDFDPDTDSSCASEEDPDESAEFYDGLFDRFQKEGPILGNHADSTKKMIAEQEVQWTR
jgi:hypothetical protein